MPARKYYCDYCDKQFYDTPASRERHLQGISHQRAKKQWFDSFRGEFPCLLSLPLFGR
jgi:U11/U12 small nuclear ribonucleoprotein SNRNP20